MFGDKDAIATVGVKNLAQARRFYEEVLGLQVMDTRDGDAIMLRSANSRLIVYRSDRAGTNQATAMTWMMGTDIDRVVEELEEKGVKFEHYDLPGLTQKGDVHSFGDFKAAWFKDPDGNILALMGQ
jgi:catechol 2,3-dioxygenase-like lactoylglutathione lyase family enzyme